MKRKTLVLNSVLAVSAVGLVAFGVTSLGAQGSASATETETTVRTGNVTQTVSATGNAVAAQDLTLNFASGGILTEVDVASGQTVAQGQVLAKVDSTTAENQLRTAQANLASAQARMAKGVDGFSAKNNFAANGYDTHSPGGYNLAAVIVAEIVMTAFLTVTIAAIFHWKFSAGFAGVSIGLVLTLIHLISIPIDNTSVNPARSLGVALFAGSDALKQLWVFIIFPIVGGVAGAVLYQFMAGKGEPEPQLERAGDLLDPPAV